MAFSDKFNNEGHLVTNFNNMHIDYNRLVALNPFRLTINDGGRVGEFHTKLITYVVLKVW